jgi:hypothetical protein
MLVALVVQAHRASKGTSAVQEVLAVRDHKGIKGSLAQVYKASKGSLAAQEVLVVQAHRASKGT